MDIGGGIGAIQAELLTAGASQGEIFELVGAYERYATELASAASVIGTPEHSVGKLSGLAVSRRFLAHRTAHTRTDHTAQPPTPPRRENQEVSASMQTSKANRAVALSLHIAPHP